MLTTGMTPGDYISVSKDRRCLYPAKHHSSASPKIEQARLAASVETPSKVHEFLSFHSLQPTRKKSESNPFLAGFTTSFLLCIHLDDYLVYHVFSIWNVSDDYLDLCLREEAKQFFEVRQCHVGFQLLR